MYFTEEHAKAISDFMLFLEDNNIKVVSLDEKVSLRTAKHAFDIISKGSIGKVYRERKPDLFIISSWQSTILILKFDNFNNF